MKLRVLTIKFQDKNTISTLVKILTHAYPEFVRPTDANGQMILSEKDLNDRSKGKVFLPADEPIVVKHGTVF